MHTITLEEAEDDLRAAYLDDDPVKIAAAEAIVDRLDVHPAPIPLLSAALWYAEKGLRVFALQPGSKIPHKGTRGCHDATTDPDVIRAWWERWPGSNVAIATGHLIDVVDIDGALGQASRCANWESNFAQIDSDCIAKVLTPRPGGMHLMVPATGDGNSAGIFPGIDYRGMGGYVVAAPSFTDVGTYRFLGAPHFDLLAAVAA